MTRIVVGVSGASAMPLAHGLLAHLAALGGVELHLVVSAGARAVLAAEPGPCLDDLTRLAARMYAPDDLAAAPASGSWQHDGMVVCPCSMSSLACIATGCGRNLLHRACDVTLKERRPLVLVPRETPLSTIHLRNMLAASEAGACIMPFAPASYVAGMDLAAQVRHFTGRVLDQLHIDHDLCQRWTEDRP